MSGKTVTKLVRVTDRYIAERDNYSCVLCGKNWPVEIHHIVYRSHPNPLTESRWNRCVLCRGCHTRIGGQDLGDGVPVVGDSLEWRKRLLAILGQRYGGFDDLEWGELWAIAKSA
jgi:5-methylcytosine-specific restriction endonuclease McrA